MPERSNVLLPQPKNSPYRCCVVEYNVPGGQETDKSSDGHRYDSVPIANGVIRAGVPCDIIKYRVDKHDEFAKACKK